MTPRPSDVVRGGFITIHRQIEDWPLYVALRSGEQAHVITILILMANWKDTEVWIGGRKVIVKRGQILASEETIARRAKTSRKVVRGMLSKLDQSGFLYRESIWAIPDPVSGPSPGPAKGPTPTLITIRNYGTYQGLRENEGPTTGQQRGQSRADLGPIKGPTGAPSEPYEPVEPYEPYNHYVVEASASDDAGPFERVEAVWNRVCVPVGFAKSRSTPQQRKAARARLREPGWLEAYTLACSHMATDAFYRGGGDRGWIATLGWLLKPGNAERTAERAATKPAAPQRSLVTAPAEGGRTESKSVSAPASPATEFTGGVRSWDD